MALIPIRPGSKAPRDTGWPQAEYARDELLAWFLRGHSLGFRLGPSDVVLDVDPRAGGRESLAKLQTNLGIDFVKLDTTKIRTGGNGLHIYFVMDNAPPMSEKHAAYPGLELKKQGKQVLIPGSTHPDTGKIYKFVPPFEKGPLRLSPADGLPSTFAATAFKGPSETRASTAGSTIISPAQLTQLLGQLPVEEYDSNAAWLPVLAAAYHSTGGAGLGEFLAWSLSDPKYSDHEQVVTARWKSMSNPSPTERSLGTLIYEVRKHGGETPEGLPREHDALAELLHTPIPDLPSRPAKTIEEIREAIGQLAEGAPNSAVEPVLRAASAHPPVVRYEVIQRLNDATKIPIPVLRQALQFVVRDSQMTGAAPRVKELTRTDLATQIVSAVLNGHYAGGKHLIHARDQNYWKYTGKSWEMVHKNLIENVIYVETSRFQAAHPDSKIAMSAIISQASIILRARAAVDIDLFSPERTDRPVINCANRTLDVDPSTGHVQAREHRAEDYLTHCLPVGFNPDARCPKFDLALIDFFGAHTDSQEIIDYVWEIIGYTIQPRKDLPAWFLFHGPGENGKSTVLKIISALLGPAALHQNIDAFGKAEDAFALADLVGKLAVIDDDVRHRTLLPDDFLKKCTENKQLHANPKWGTRFAFTCATTILLGANSWPQTRDLSKGMRRRAHVIPFTRQFSADEIIIGYDRQLIAEELSGILTSALAGLQRLRARGKFSIPLTCKKATEQWLANSNQTLVFLDQLFLRSASGCVAVTELWGSYVAWCLESGGKRGFTRHGLLSAIGDLGFKVTEDRIFGIVRRK